MYIAMALAALSTIAVASRAAELPIDSAPSRSRYLMGTVCEVAVDGELEKAEAAFAEIARIEQLISTWRESSELSRANQSRCAIVSRELFTLLDEAMHLARATGGAFNPLVGPLVQLWKSRGEGVVPADDDIDRVLPLLALDGPRFDSASRRINLPAGVSFEEGGFGKGYALDLAAAALESAGAERFVIDFGGQLMIRSNEPVEAAIASPERRDEIALLLSISSGSLSTSSGSEKSFAAGGRTYSHILDPRTGLAHPPRGSVSVVSGSAMRADALSTALYVMGPADGLAWANAHDVAAVFIVPASTGWTVILSNQATTSGLAVRAVRPDFNLKEGTR
ncbi:MAG: FAD:protein FMN transferase [Thermoanaerobaculia bacterium]|nr:FAD:protein FMN transferase [Thermoanaerobaculia bacterium]